MGMTDRKPVRTTLLLYWTVLGIAVVVSFSLLVQDRKPIPVFSNPPVVDQSCPYPERTAREFSDKPLHCYGTTDA